MSKQIQPKYQLLINGIDVTNDVGGDVTYRMEPNSVSNLAFSLSGREYVIGVKDVVKIGDRVEFYGGTFGKSLIEPALDNYKLFFYGNVKSLNPQYAETGLVTVNVEALDMGYTSMKEKRKFFYPTQDATVRSWANADSITVKEIMFNIIEEELNLKIGTFDVPYAESIKYTLRSPIAQAGVNDWKFLQKLAKEAGADVFTRLDEKGDTYVDVIDKSKQRNFDNNKVRFIYALRENKYHKDTPNNNAFVYKDINNIKGVVDIPVLSVSITQDLTQFYATRRTVEVYDKKEGVSINVIQTFDEITPEQRKANSDAVAQGKPEIYKVTLVEDGKSFIDAYYRMEVDDTKLPSDPKEREELKKIALNVASQDSKGENDKYSFQDIKKYFKRAEFLDPRLKVVDQPYSGIDVNLTIEGEVYLRNSRAYPILGVQRYGSDNLSESYHLIVITHRWGDDGYLCDLEFKL